ncbi:MAG TPA: hypothetical protein VF017_15000 [Thermoanaerobaculia bacterium]|nr:hypothetical protein [Thermoanaerobaculia bacterium]
MARTLSATEAARTFSDLLDRTRYGGETFVIVQGREEVARLVPPKDPAPAGTLGDFLRLLRERRAEGLVDEDFASDLAQIQASVPPSPGDPWES